MGAHISGIDFAQDLSQETVEAVHRAFLKYQVLVFSAQHIPPEQQVQLARGFGEVQIHVMNQYHTDGLPELYRLSNLDESGRPNGKHPDKGTLAWHTDSSWQRVTGHATLIYGEVMPEPGQGGQTHFCDMYGAYERLDESMKKRIASLRAVHNLDFSRSRRHAENPMTDEQRKIAPPVDHPVVRTHPQTGRKCLYLGDHAEYIVGMGYEEGRNLIEELNQLALQPDLIYEHDWQVHQLLIWDNRCLLHRATTYDPFTQKRVIRRCTVSGEIPR